MREEQQAERRVDFQDGGEERFVVPRAENPRFARHIGVRKHGANAGRYRYRGRGKNRGGLFEGQKHAACAGGLRAREICQEAGRGEAGVCDIREFQDGVGQAGGNKLK